MSVPKPIPRQRPKPGCKQTWRARSTSARGPSLPSPCSGPGRGHRASGICAPSSGVGRVWRSLIDRRLAEVYSALAAGLPVDPKPLGSSLASSDEDAAYRASSTFPERTGINTGCDAMADCPDPAEPRHGLRLLAAASRVTVAAHCLPSGCGDRRTAAAASPKLIGLSLPQAVTLATAIFIHRLTEAEDRRARPHARARMSRTARQTPAMVINVVPLRLEIRPDMRIADLAAQFRRKVRAGIRHQRYRIADLRRDLRRIDRPVIRQPSVSGRSRTTAVRRLPGHGLPGFQRPGRRSERLRGL